MVSPMRRLVLAVFAVLCLLLPNDSSCTVPKRTLGFAGNADIQLTDKVDDALASSVASEVHAAMRAGAKHLTIHIDTIGGDLDAGLGIIATIHDSGIPSTCIVYDKAFSMGAIILQSSACGERVVHAHSVVMVHGVLSGGNGPQRTLENNLARARAANLQAAQLICARTGWTIEWYWQTFVVEAREMWVVGPEAVAWHLADRVRPVPSPVPLLP